MRSKTVDNYCVRGRTRSFFSILAGGFQVFYLHRMKIPRGAEDFKYL